MGLPFYYSLEEPSMYSVRGQWKGYVERGQSQEGYNLPIKAGVNGQLEVT